MYAMERVIFDFLFRGSLLYAEAEHNVPVLLSGLRELWTQQNIRDDNS